MPLRDELGKRMKTFYETIPKTRLMRRVPVAIRLDGRAFHSFTRGFERPFDEVLITSMQETMKYLCQNIQGCVLGYHQSDEITLILIDYQKLTTDAWFDYEVQKMCSISASMATMAFNKEFTRNYLYFLHNEDLDWEDESNEKQAKIYSSAMMKGAMFDSRCFNIPKEEVANLIYWRQLDATRNSIQMVGRANFSHKELKNISNNKIQDMLMMQKGINWNNFPTHQKRGSCCIRNHMISEPYGSRMLNSQIGENEWFVDKEIPIFKGEDREYIERLIYVGE